jgi:magnesium-transporting ATPase (P-type)
VNVYEFVGSFTVGGEETIGIGLEQTLWRGVKVASGRGLVMVAYVGAETKLSLNSKEAGDKFG